MKGDVKRNTSPPTGRPEGRDIVAASLGSGRDELWIRLLECRSFITTWCGLQKLKSERAVLLSTIVLSEPQGLVLFQIVRGRIEFIMGLRRVAVVHR
jgi:hypothetical protein